MRRFAAGAHRRSGHGVAAPLVGDDAGQDGDRAAKPCRCGGARPGVAALAAAELADTYVVVPSPGSVVVVVGGGGAGWMGYGVRSRRPLFELGGTLVISRTWG